MDFSGAVSEITAAGSPRRPTFARSSAPIVRMPVRMVPPSKVEPVVVSQPPVILSQPPLRSSVIVPSHTTHTTHAARRSPRRRSLMRRIGGTRSKLIQIARRTNRKVSPRKQPKARRSSPRRSPRHSSPRRSPRRRF